MSIILTTLDYKPHWKNGVKNIQAAVYNGKRTVSEMKKGHIISGHNFEIQIIVDFWAEASLEFCHDIFPEDDTSWQRECFKRYLRRKRDFLQTIFHFLFKSTGP